MATFDANKFLNFYGFVPKILNKAKAEVLPVLNDKLRKEEDRPFNPLFEPWLFDLIIDDYFFEIPPVITVNLRKNVVTTKIAGSSRPPVIEIIGYDSFDIKIQGYMENSDTYTVTSKPNKLTQVRNALDLVESKGEINIRDNIFPIEKLEDLYKIFKRNEALPVECELLEIFGISRIVITSMPEITYYPTAFTYTLNAVADAHEEILVLED